MKANEAEALAARLAGHPDYRVVRRLQAAERPALVSKLVRRAALVDTETTGTDPATDKVMELAIVVFEYCAAAPCAMPSMAPAMASAQSRIIRIMAVESPCNMWSVEFTCAKV